MLNVLLPFSEDKAMILFHLDMKGIAVQTRAVVLKTSCFGRNAFPCRFKKTKSAHFV
jgi:hypothetical protein